MRNTNSNHHAGILPLFAGLQEQPRSFIGIVPTFGEMMN
jgi:hypothetical protein